MLNSNYKKSRLVFFTNDVETFSLRNHCLSDKTGEKVLKKGMPILLELYKKYNVRSTFFFTGYIAEKFPEIVKMILLEGHEVGCHGYTHFADSAFDVLTLNEQVQRLKKSKTILEDISGQEVISFRAPALRVNEFTVRALELTSFKIDSSVASQRGDMFFSFGSFKKLNWITAPRKCYYTDKNNMSRKGTSGIFEIPINSYLIPYIGTFMRISPIITKILRRLVDFETKLSNHIPVFIIHPNEFIEEDLNLTKFSKRTKNIISYLIADKLRYKLKLRNLGIDAISLFEDQIKFFYNRNYKFITLKEYFKIMQIKGVKNETNGS